MNILEKEVLTQEDIDQLNTLLSDPKCDTLKKAVRKLMGKEASATEVTDKYRELYAKIKDSGYKSNPDTKLYELNRDTKKTNKENKKPKSEKQEVKVAKNEPVKEEKKKVTTPKKARRTKKEIEEERRIAEFEESLKVNPLMLFSRTGHEITDKLFDSSKDATIGTGVYLLPSIVEEFKAIEEVFSHIYNYKLIDASIQLTYSKRNYLMESNIFMDFMRLMNNDKLALKPEETRRKELLAGYKQELKEYNRRKESGEKVGAEPKKPTFPHLKKQLNLKLSQTASDNLDILCDNFSMFTKSEVINLCMFALSESAKTTFLSNN